MPGQGAAPRADLDPDSPECDIAARYLVDQRFIAPADAASEYTITVAGFDRVREMRGIGGPAVPAGRNRMSDKTQKQLMTLLSIGSPSASASRWPGLSTRRSPNAGA